MDFLYGNLICLQEVPKFVYKSWFEEFSFDVVSLFSNIPIDLAIKVAKLLNIAFAWIEHEQIGPLYQLTSLSIGDFSYIARASFFKEIGELLAGSSQSKQLRIKLS